MIRFRQRNFTIPEGHYTGPKNIEEIPGAVEMATKGALAGLGIGAVSGAISNDLTVGLGAVKGAEYGAASGVLAKFLLNYIHNPMKSLKYQEVDKAIRRQFGVFQVAGIEVGGTVDKRAKLEEKFSYNDRNVSSYKINIAICNNKFTMYTFGMSRVELDKTSGILDAYCKKYYSMEYDSKLINQRANSYSIAIIFTNVQAICSFIMELSNALQTKINLLDDKAIVLPRLEEASQSFNAEEEEGEEPVERKFSVSELSTFDLVKIVSGGIVRGLMAVKNKTQEALLQTLLQASIKLNNNDLQRMGVQMKLGDLDNMYLESTLKKLHYVEGFHYTVSGSESGAKSNTNISLISGVLYITINRDDKDTLYKFESKFYNHYKSGINKMNTGNVVLYSYPISSEKEFKNLLNALMKTDIKFNIFNESVSDTGKKFGRLLGKFHR